MGNNIMTEKQVDTELTAAFQRVLKHLRWFWTNPTVRKYLLISKLPRDRVRTISEFLDEADRRGTDQIVEPGRVDPLVPAGYDLVEAVKNEVKPMIELEIRRAGPDRGDYARTQLELTRSTLEINTESLLRDLEALHNAASEYRK